VQPAKTQIKRVVKMASAKADQAKKAPIKKAPVAAKAPVAVKAAVPVKPPVVKAVAKAPTATKIVVPHAGAAAKPLLPKAVALKAAIVPGRPAAVPVGVRRMPAAMPKHPGQAITAAAAAPKAAVDKAALARQQAAAAAALHGEREQLRVTLASIGDGVIVTDTEGRVRFLNAVAERLTGWTTIEARERPLDEIFVIANEITEQPVENLVRRVLREGRPIGPANHTILKHRQGRSQPIADSGAPVRNDEGEIEGVVLVFRDQTAERDTGRQLRRSQGLLQAISDKSPTVTYVKDLEGRYLFVNQSFLDLFHITQQEILGRTDIDRFGAEIAERFRSMDRRVVEANGPLTEEELVPVDGGERTYLSVKCPLWDEAGKPYAVFGVSTDITDRKQIERALVESRQYYQAMAESLPHLVWTCRADGYCDYLSRQWVDYTGRAAEEQLGAGWAEAVHPDDRARVEVEWGLAVQRGDLYDEEFRLRRHDGTYRWFRTRGVPLRDATGTLVKWFGSNTDVEDYKQAEQRLRAQLERMDLLDRLTRAIGEHQDLTGLLRVVVRSLEDHLPLDYCCACLYDAGDRTVSVVCIGPRGEELARALRLGEGAMMRVDGNGLSRCLRGQLVYEPDISAAPTPFAQQLASGGIRSFVGAPLVVESKVFGVLIAARRVAAGFTSSDCEFLRQLSEHVGLAAHQAQLHTALQRAYDDLRQTQQAVMQQERLRALGQMASGIAHDINNAISPIALYTELLIERECNLSAQGREYLKTIQRAIDDVAATVARMREFYRQRDQQAALQPVHLHTLVQQVVDLTRARWRDMPQQRGIVIDLQIDLAAEAPAISGVESEIREALTNLIFNAVDAMPQGGTMTLRTVATGAADAPRYMHLEVTDTGAGMDEHTRRRCLEPFFTTKGERGTGLGLAMVYGMMQRHGGDIAIESEVGRGSTMRLSFPVPTTPVTESTSAGSAPMVASHLRILVVDDDPSVLRSLLNTLESEGHTVVAAAGGQEGIDVFCARHNGNEAFSVVITDLGMPYVDGHQVASAVKSASFATPVIMLTGWGQRIGAGSDVPAHVDQVLAKPAKLRELRVALARCCAHSLE
jgi:PAS domain S-box-containing protein